jgi:hypothetical protein
MRADRMKGNSLGGDRQKESDATRDDRSVLASPSEVARYIAAMSEELLWLARGADLPMLAFLLDMVRIEAEAVNGGEN